MKLPNDISRAESLINPKTRVKFKSESGNSIIDYYTEAGPDYEFWSKNFNMHFGYADKKWDCVSREKMLQRMNQVVLDSLDLFSGHDVLDMGCGLAATIRYGALKYPRVNFKGVTITPWQVKKSEEMIRQLNIKNATIIHGDYNELPINSNTIDAAFGLESICHAEGANKSKPLSEAYRVLKNGGRFTIIDGFIKIPEVELSPTTRKMYNLVCQNWALPSFGNINEVVFKMESIGFRELVVEEISWRVAPSAIHSPFLSLFFIIKSFFKGEKLKKQNWNNLKACFTIFFLGLSRKSIGYYKITATK
tara:strand:- start:179 stop:1096 length:918 start_codon:yes stop_codon:yes gene_type:complete